MKKTLVALLMSFVATAFADTVPLTEWKPGSNCRIDGNVLTVDLPAGRPGYAAAKAKVDLSKYDGKSIFATIRARGKALVCKGEKWEGMKFMLHYKEAKTGVDNWPGARAVTGDFDWKTLKLVCTSPHTRGVCEFTLGIQNGTGRLEFDLSTLKIEEVPPLWPVTNQTWRCEYTEKVKSRPQYKGVMLGHGMKEDDFKVLHDWGVTLARFQMTRGWNSVGANRDIEDYWRYIDTCLDDLENHLKWAEKYGIKIVIDLHAAPGARDEHKDEYMFHDAKYADAFIETWRRIARRFRNRESVYGFDLINEPQQTDVAQPGCDYWTLQSRAAEAIREIDPETPIIIESNYYDAPSAFAFMCPLRLKNIIYQAHMYQPMDFTHQGVQGKWKPVAYPDREKGYDREFLRKALSKVREFELKHGARIYIGEFSAISWAEGAGEYIADVISIMDEYGWDWSYHAFREWQGWSVEHAAAQKGPGKYVASDVNPRKRALLNGFRKRVEPAVRDAMKSPRLGDVKLGGHPGAKLDAFVRERMTSEFAQREIFGEARRAFELRDDDIRGFGGVWRGEFWGKLMLGTARVADYLRDPGLLRFVDDECMRLVALQDEDGYLGSYKDKELVAITDPEKTRSIYGWHTCWNLWNRKYCIWGMLMAYRATRNPAILRSVEAQMDQWIEMLHRLGFRLHDTGTLGMNGLPSMSVLKPLLMLYAETGNKAYLDYAEEMLPDWDRDDGACPNFFRNASKAVALSEWYPNAQEWAKAYEMMSCLDGLLEHYRVTGSRRSLETVAKIRDNLAKNEYNPFGGVGFGDKLLNAPSHPDALSEVCDAIHWIRLNLDLFLITGEDRYMDTVELCYLNNFLPGVFRRGDYGAFFIRGQCRHENQFQCGFAYNHCCVNNMPRTWMDVAEGTVTRDQEGVFHVNLYQDAEVKLDGVKFTIAGNYPVGSKVTVTVSDPAAKIRFRKPAWCGKLDVGDDGKGVYTLVFDMPARLVERDLKPLPADKDEDARERWMHNRYSDNRPTGLGSDVYRRYRKTAAAALWRGPMLLAKAKRIGDTEAEIFNPESVNLKGYIPRLVEIPDPGAYGVWGAWTVELTKEGAETVRVKACDFESAGDDPRGQGANAFSIWW